MPTRRSTRLASLIGSALLIAHASGQDPARRLLEELTLEQRAAQLIVCFSHARLDADYARGDELRKQIADPGIGGIVLSLGEAATPARLIEDLQRRAAIPLLVAGDFEEGLAFRLKDTSDFGSAMLIGATRSARLAYAAGRATAEEARALGFHWNFAPVLDVGLEPANPIIGVRSFGEDPALVARLGASLVRGTQSAGVMATAKHFPGHGDVAVDSHVALPTVTADRARLAAVELLPFESAIDAGVAAIMTGHLAVPALDETGTPATLSSPVLDGVLRKSLGFDGLVVTDSLGMRALEGATSDRAEAAVRALAAGADVLLMPPDPIAARDAVVAAVREGRIPAARLDGACLRVLRAKAQAGLFDGAGLPDPRWRAVVRSPAHEALAAEIAWRGITIVRDPAGLVPVRARRVVLVCVQAGRTGERGEALLSALASRAGSLELHRLPRNADDAVRAAAIGAVTAAGDDPDAVTVCAVFPRPGRQTPRMDDVFAAVAAAPRAVVVTMGNPWATTALGDTTSYVAAYHDSEPVERAVGALLGGRGPATGRLPVTVPAVAAFGEGLSWLPPTPATLPRAAPETQGLAVDLERRIRARLERAVAEQAFPGAVALVARRGHVVAEVAVGHETFDADAAPVWLDSLWDMASLTKVCATTPTVLRLIDRGELSFDALVHELVPAFDGPQKESVTVRHLLTHTAGLPPFRRFFADLRGREEILAAAAATPLERAPGERTVYSDIGMMMLMACVENVTGQRFEEVVRREVFEPLRMHSARFALTGEPIDAVPTEIDELRKGVVRGQVHDENAWAMGGVSGHAGLFGTADDVVRVGLAFLGGGRGWLSPSLARTAIRRAEVVPGSSRALGWDTFESGGSGGSRLSAEAFGHTGFTGTSMWCDPTRDLAIVLLTNRVHPTRENQRHKAVRADVADLVIGALRE